LIRCLALIIFPLAVATLLADSVGQPPPPGASGDARNVPHIGKRTPDGHPVRLATATGHVSNYDEALVGDAPLPDPLRFANGQRVETARQWREERRKEILGFYESQIYGSAPPNAPRVSWRSVGRNDRGALKYEGLMGGNPEGPKIRLTLDLPDAADGPAPVLLHLSFFGGQRARSQNRSNRFEPRQAVLKRGWAFAEIAYGDIQPDRPDRWREGVIGLTLKEGTDRPAPDAWGTIGAWAWGASRVLDHLSTLEAIDATRMTLAGASRLGKTALWAAALDERVAAVMSIVPGAMGAALIRRDYGETLDDMAQNFPWQFAGNLQNWVGRQGEMPADQHMLIGLIAPRLVYVNGGLGDQWSDPKGEFLAMTAAGPVYRLLGAAGLDAAEPPPLDQPLLGSHLAFHFHSLGHRAVPEDWTYFMDFAEGHFASRSTTSEFKQ